MAVDCLGICKYHTKFLSPNNPAFKEWPELIKLITDLEFTPQEIWTIAERAYNIERLFNIREGFSRNDDMLVDRYFEEPTPEGLDVVKGKTIDRKKFEKMIDEYYGHHDWDNNGVPTDKTLQRLGLENEPSKKL